ncbi:unnamed protein product [Prorocentrum cordatum]|uniref:Uncharacterized protein n=1 Tax=Prorocentrum cordatum TaxID=2364126 RepID=A0ABN9TV46_9DINO|nr:unnamed protein product [Polarella glacialis]
MVCRGFDRGKYEATQWEEKLQHAFQELTQCEDEFALVAEIRSGIADTTKAEIDELLERVGRMRAIGIQSRKVGGAAPPTGGAAEGSARPRLRSEANGDMPDLMPAG